eukprot:13034876-Alexandrium_andersonii.AAC.1
MDSNHCAANAEYGKIGGPSCGTTGWRCVLGHGLSDGGLVAGAFIKPKLALQTSLLDKACTSEPSVDGKQVCMNGE